jgi:hypothetical protein
MSSVQPHREFHESIENNRPPAHSTRSKTPRPGTASRMAAAAPKGSSKGQARRGQSRTATAPPDLSDSSLSDMEESTDEAVQEPARKRRRTTATPAPTPARAAEAEMVQRAKDLRARAELIEAENALRKAEMNSLALREQGDTSASQGTYSDRVMSIATQLCVQPQLVSDIAGNRFIAVDIARLCSYVGPARWEETTITPKLVNGVFSFSHSHAKIADFKGDVARWNEGFGNYASIWGLLFGAKYPETVTAMWIFLTHLLQQQVTYTANACIEYACTRLNLIFQGGVEKSSLWQEKPPQIEARYFTLVHQKQGKGDRPKSGRNKPSTAVCNNFNNATCNWKGCSRRHECSKCGSGSHGAKECKAR